MNALSFPDTQLLQIVSAAAPATISDVLVAMQRIDDVLPGNDGLKWFNLLYMKVTEKIDTETPPTGWQDEPWLTLLDVVFAKLYFAAIAGYLTQSANTPSSWAALFEARSRANVDRIQFALAGMNAHINHDLALALLQTDAEMHLNPGRDGPEHADYETVNDLLEAELPVALTFLATGILGELAQDTGKIGQLLAGWNVRKARDLAWDFSSHLRDLPGPVRNEALKFQDALTGVIGRGLLVAL